MLSWKKPSVEVLESFLAAQQQSELTFAAVGATAASPPLGFAVDHTRVELGSGEAVFRIACDALRSWRQFELGWVEAWPTNAPIRAGESVVVIGRSLGLWWLNACRIVRVINEEDAIYQFGFAYGTLPAHVECGEERFIIEWERTTDRVFFDILAFSRPNYFLSRVGYPYLRRLQKKFGRESAAAMVRAVHSNDLFE